ncbi:CRISPR-associated helicase Cas3' [Paenibacillus dendritiformis]|uniref:CRISPR-associated helicase Cas3' n=1 Tax=Paenibacillus dendritiformis TaxID=130049 RepID=UPI000DAA2340|nr:CRISPR-associated helicase Cas3' [Paenibacillus dendritiformis]PZM67202.1 CRISPR-associated helicase/endonuclease Cas3 [Paenibacillus dendritiformis]
MRSIAHIRVSDEKVQTVEQHLLEVMTLAEEYGKKLNIPHVTGLAGMLHDMGKYTEKFRTYILAAVSGAEDRLRRGDVDHSTAGGRLLYDRCHDAKAPYKAILAEVVGNAIISHHSYLHDFLDPDLESPYLRRVACKKLEEFDQSVEAFFTLVMSEQEFQRYVDQAAVEVEQFLARVPAKSMELKLMFLTKFVFSALIDADRTNTRWFELGEPNEPEQNVMALFQGYYDKLMAQLHSFEENKDADTPIARLRSEMSELCERFAAKPSSIYTLSIPTGGGKTLASLRYALKHALTYDKKRIIYVVPFTTIIEQNAATVREILQDEANILEHHSNVVEVEMEEDDEEQDGLALTARQKANLAKDNWDAPIIFTTMVQFLNVFFAHGSRNIRRLHNLCEAVIIFDEVQKVPTHCVSLFNQALNFLKEYGGSSIVLCTATQPALQFVEQRLDMPEDAEMISNLDKVIDAFKRVDLIDKATERPWSTEDLASFVRDTVQEAGNILVILNTKSVVKSLYERLQAMREQHQFGEDEEIFLYHLSTSMCAAHRFAILEKVRAHLEAEEKVICVSTQLIEAGVDVSFNCVVRSLAGLDSIAQAAGRCNRHGKDEMRNVYIIDHAEENLKHLKEIQVGKELTRAMLVDMKRDAKAHGGQLLSQQAMEFYFQKFYMRLEADLNNFVPKLRKNMTDLLYAGRYETDSYFQAYHKKKEEEKAKDTWLPLVLANSYGTAAKYFHVIDDYTRAVIVPYGGGTEVIADLNGSGTIDDLTRLLKRAQQFTVNLYEHDLRQLDRSGGLESCLDGKVLVLKDGAYSEHFGVDLSSDSAMGFLGCF